MSETYPEDNGKPIECRLCPLYNAPGIVPGEGPKNAKIFLLGEAPGETEILINRPFVGGAGRILNRLLATVKIQRSQTYITNVVKCRPTVINHEGKLKDRPPTPTEIECCARFLVDELESVKPNVIVGLGGTALFALKDTNKIGQHRGVPFPTSFGKALCTYHPAGLMRQQQLFPLAIRDLALALKEAESPDLVRLEVTYNPNASAAGNGVALRQRARAAGYVTLDLETTGLDPRYDQILCCGAGTEPQKAECYAWNSDNERLLRTLYEDPTLEKVGQNCEGFDWWFLHGKGWPEAPAGKSYDTLLAFHLTNSDLPKDLGTLGATFTDMEYWKHEGKKAFKDAERSGNLFLYNCKDIDGTTRSYLSTKKLLQQYGMLGLYYNNVMPLQPILRRMSKRGIKKDVEKAAKWSLAFNMVADQKEQVLRDGLNAQDFSVNSPKQLMRLFYEQLGLPIQYVRDKDRGSRPTVNDDAMEALAIITNDPIFHLVNEIRQCRKFASTYCDAITDEDGYLHPRFGCAKAANGRLNSWDPNGQNWPNDLRELVIPDSPDHIFLACDWSQIEWRNSMILTADPAGLEMMKAGVDNHSVTAAECFTIDIGLVNEEVPGINMAYRQAAKFIVYGLGYGRGIRSIAMQLGKDEAWVAAFVQRYFAKFHVFADGRNQWEQFVRHNNYLRNPFSRRRWWYSMQVPELYNFLPSSTAADMMYLVIPKVESQLPSGATLRLTVHDELVICCTRDAQTVKQSAMCLQENMSRMWPEIVEASNDSAKIKRYYPQGWHCPTDLSIGNTWKDCKDKKIQYELKKEYNL
jgi:uracil-DNA glycosylase family 4